MIRPSLLQLHSFIYLNLCLNTFKYLIYILINYSKNNLIINSLLIKCVTSWKIIQFKKVFEKIVNKKKKMYISQD